MLRTWLAIGMSLMGVTLGLAGVFAWASRPTTYRDAVIEVLAQHEIIYTDLDVHKRCLLHPNNRSRCIRTYHTVVVYRDSANYGQLTCFDREGDCYLDSVSLGIQRAPVRDPQGVRLLPKPLSLLVEKIAVSMRSGNAASPDLASP